MVIYYEKLLSSNTHVGGKWRLLKNATEAPTDTAAPLERVYRTEHAFIVALVLGTVGILASLGACMFVYLNRKKKVVAIGQPPFLYLMCLGCIFIATTTCLLALDETSGLSQAQLSGYCVAFLWLFALGFLVMYMALFSKLLRVSKVTQIRRNIVIKPKHVIGPFVTVILSALGVLIAATVVAPPEWQIIEFSVDDDFAIDDDELDVEDIFPGANKAYGFCTFPDPYFLILLLLIITSQVITCVMSCKLRRIPQDLSDSRRACQAIWFHIIVVLLGTLATAFGLYFGSVNVQAIAFMLVAFLTVSASLCFLVVPKMYSVGYEKFKGHSPGDEFGGRVHISGISTRLPSTDPTQSPSLAIEPSIATNEPIGHVDNHNDYQGDLSEASPVAFEPRAEEKNCSEASTNMIDKGLPPEGIAFSNHVHQETAENATSA